MGLHDLRHCARDDTARRRRSSQGRERGSGSRVGRVHDGHLSARAPTMGGQVANAIEAALGGLSQ
jgi:hypothetical protein